MPIVISSVINHQILLVVRILLVPSIFSNLLFALSNMSDQGVYAQIVIINASPTVSICFPCSFSVTACPITLVIEIQKMLSITASVILINIASVLVLGLHGGFKFLCSK
eukprot:8648504-Heterocapsa_arctica.AAC.1